MLWSQKNHYFSINNLKKRRYIRLVNKKIQFKYSFILSLILLLAMSILYVPLYQSLKNNYKLFIDLSYSYAPNIIEHLNREWFWSKILLFTSIFVIITICFIFTINIIAKIISPILLLNRHMNQFINGEWNIRDVSTREDDEFQDLIDNYNYLTKKIKLSIEEELNLLKKIKIEPNDPESKTNLDILINRKNNQILVPIKKEIENKRKEEKKIDATITSLKHEKSSSVHRVS